jgi:hypothetical protein
VNALERIIYVDKDGNRSIHFDHSITSTFQTCEEKARLAYFLHLAPNKEERPLSYGSAIHAGLHAFDVTGNVDDGVEAFCLHLQGINSQLPIEMKNDENERRSVERGTYLIRAYAERWSDDSYEVAIDATGKPMAEIGFSIFLREYEGIPIMLSGKIDCVKKSKQDGQYYNWERKTSSGSVYSVLQNTRPNHQITIYDYAIKTLLGVTLGGTALDAIYVSDRQPNPKKGGWMNYGIDIEKDFGRAFTVRSETDRLELIEQDMSMVVEDILRRVSSDRPRWRMNAPTACSMYGGCKFKKICETNRNQNIIETEYVVRPWHPWALAEEEK